MQGMLLSFFDTKYFEKSQLTRNYSSLYWLPADPIANLHAISWWIKERLITYRYNWLKPNYSEHH